MSRMNTIDTKSKKNIAFLSIVERHEHSLQNKLLENLLQTYHNMLSELEHNHLTKNSTKSPPRMDYFLRSILSFTLLKIHKGDKLKAYELLNDITDSVLSLELDASIHRTVKF